MQATQISAANAYAAACARMDGRSVTAPTPHLAAVEVTELRGCYVARCGGLMIVCDAVTHGLVGVAIVRIAVDGDCDIQGLQTAG